MHAIHGICGALLITVLAAPTEAGQLLRYRGAPGEEHRFVLDCQYHLPVGSSRPFRLSIADRVTDASDAQTTLDQTIVRSRPGTPDRTVRIQLGIAATGDVRILGGDAPADAEGVSLTGTTALLLPALPDRVVEPGATWSSHRVFPLPPLPIRTPPQVKVDVDYTLVRFDRAAGREAAVVTYEGRESPGEEVSLRFSGTCTLDVKTGVPRTGQIAVRAQLPGSFPRPPLSARFTIGLSHSENVDPTGGFPARLPVSLLAVGEQ